MFPCKKQQQVVYTRSSAHNAITSLCDIFSAAEMIIDRPFVDHDPEFPYHNETHAIFFSLFNK